MIGSINNAIRLQVERVLSRQFSSRDGFVTSYNPNTYTVKVEIQPEGIVTGDIPFAAAWVGNGWGMYAPPTIGQQVKLSFFQGSLGTAFAEACLFNNSTRPLPVPSGEWWLVHKNGQSIKLTNDGKLTINDGHGASLELDGAGNLVSQATQWTHTGTVTFDGNVNVSQTLTATTDVISGTVSLKNHLTQDVTSGTSLSGPPLP